MPQILYSLLSGLTIRSTRTFLGRVGLLRTSGSVGFEFQSRGSTDLEFSRPVMGVTMLSRIAAFLDSAV